MTNRVRSVGSVLAIGLILFIVGLLLPYLAAFLIADTRRTVTETALQVRNYWKQELIAFAVVGVAYLLYRIKHRWLAWYGGLEIAVAYLGAFHSTTKSLSLIMTGSLETLDTDAERVLALLAFVGSIYVGVQGFENLKAGLKARREQAVGITPES
jgi:hypothetical protein